MAKKLPQSLSVGGGGGRGRASSLSHGGGASSSHGGGAPINMDHQMEVVEQLVLDLRYPVRRERALLELSMKRELFHDLAPLLCNSFGTSTVFLQEIISIYSFLSPPNLTPAQSNRVCNVLALLQCVASHPDTRMSLLNANIPSYLYAFLVTTSNSRPFEYLRLASLGVIGALVKADDTEVNRALLSQEIIPSFLRSMDIGCELSKTVSASPKPVSSFIRPRLT
ncbi:CCR4-NOT transcription complex subunit 9-like [Capsicum annuum]